MKQGNAAGEGVKMYDSGNYSSNYKCDLNAIDNS